MENFLTSHPVISTILGWILTEALARVPKTDKDYSPASNFGKIINFIIPNRKKDGGTF